MGKGKDRTKLRTEHNLKERYEEGTELKVNRCGQKRIEGEVIRTEQNKREEMRTELN